MMWQTLIHWQKSRIYWLSLTTLKNVLWGCYRTIRQILLVKGTWAVSAKIMDYSSLFIALALYYIKVFHFRSRPPGLPTHTTPLSKQGPQKHEDKMGSNHFCSLTFMQLFKRNISTIVADMFHNQNMDFIRSDFFQNPYFK